jgi:hypothetical protein
MTTIVINGNSVEGRMLVNMLREAKKTSSSIVSIEEEDLEYIPGLPHTREECLSSLRNSLDEYRRTGITISMEEMRAKHPRI